MRKPFPSVSPKRKAARSNRAGRARLSAVIVCELVSVDCKDGVPRIHTRAIVKRGSFPSAIPKYALYQKVLFLLYRKVGIPLREARGEGGN